MKPALRNLAEQVSSAEPVDLLRLTRLLSRKPRKAVEAAALAPFMRLLYTILLMQVVKDCSSLLYFVTSS